ncbi:cyclophilin-like domain-containing protein, partial [Auriculariales sp. MPI-PUGE-AT-0066]
VNARPQGYKIATFHSIPGFRCQCGDILNNDGTGTFSIYGDRFDGENLEIKHTAPGLLSMVNSGRPDTNGCRFFITIARCNLLDWKHVVIEGMLVVRKIENVQTDNYDRPKLTFKIV